MIVLDTNVISALMQTEPDPKVVDWLDEQAAESIWTTSITVFEVRFGLEVLALGARRKRLTADFESLIIEDLAGRILDLDASAANEAAVAAFLDGQIGFQEIVPACRGVLENHPFDPRPSLEQLLDLDRWARQEVVRWVCA